MGHFDDPDATSGNPVLFIVSLAWISFQPKIGAGGASEKHNLGNGAFTAA